MTALRYGKGLLIGLAIGIALAWVTSWIGELIATAGHPPP